jgi:2-haloalkanoic acid dehalogenase type II
LTAQEGRGNPPGNSASSAARSSGARVFDVVLFDLGYTLIYFDGTWADVFPQAVASLVDFLQAAGYPLDAVEFDRRFNEALQEYYTSRDADFIEYTTLYVLRQLLAEMGHFPVVDDQLRSALVRLYAVSQAYWKPEKETIQTLEELRQAGYRLGLISNAADDQDVQVLIDNAGLRSFFEIILTSAAVGIRKPHPRIFQMALDRWGASPGRAVMVGDTLGADVLGAQNAGMASIWVTRRADRRENTAHEDTIQPDASIESLAELPSLLDHWHQRPVQAILPGG